MKDLIPYIPGGKELVEADRRIKLNRENLEVSDLRQEGPLFHIHMFAQES